MQITVGNACGRERNHSFRKRAIHSLKIKNGKICAMLGEVQKEPSLRIKEKKAIAMMFTMMLAATVTACGGSSEEKPAAAPKAATEAAEAEEEEEVEEEAEEEEVDAEAEDAEAEDAEPAEESSGFSLMDVTADMIDQGMYAKDDEGNELVVTLFKAPDATPMISMFVFDASGSGDVICGAYGSENVSVAEDENGVTVSTVAISDIYTGNDCVVIFAEKDGATYVGNLNGDLYEGQLLSPEDTITYMGTAVALMQ